MRFLRRKRSKTPSVIIVSLIDVLLVVLIFLMVTTTAKKAEPVLKLVLPESKESKPGESTEDKPFVVYVGIEGTNTFYYLGEHPVTLERLQVAMAEAVEKNPKIRVEVKSDKRAHFGEIIRLIDASKVAKIGSLNFVTEKPAAQ